MSVCVCGAGYESLLEAVRIPDLSLLYGFFARFKDGMPLMSKAFANYIKVSLRSTCIYSNAEAHVHVLIITCT